MDPNPKSKIKIVAIKDANNFGNQTKDSINIKVLLSKSLYIKYILMKNNINKCMLDARCSIRIP